MEDNYTSFKIHSNYYAGILDVIEDLPEAERNSILAEYFLAFHEYGNTRKIPTFKNKIAQGFFKTHLYSIDKSFADNDVYCASHDVGSYGGKQKAINAKIRAAEKKYQEAEKKLEELEAKAEAKAEQALAEMQPNNTEKDDKSLDNKGISSGQTKEQTVSGSHQLQKKQQPQKQQQLQKEQQLGKSQQLDWQCVAGLELTEQQQQEAIRIRKANNTTKKTRTFTQASLKQFLTQVKYSIDAGISIDEVLEKWEGKQWVTWTHSYYSKEIASDIKAQSQTAKNLKGVQASQEPVRDNNFHDLGEMSDTVREMLEISYKGRMNETNKGGN